MSQRVLAVSYSVNQSENHAFLRRSPPHLYEEIDHQSKGADCVRGGGGTIREGMARLQVAYWR